MRRLVPGVAGTNCFVSDVNVAAPVVTVMIGNEQLDARMYSVAGSAMSSASRGSTYQRGGV